MHHYQIFGGVLRSEIEIGQLRPVAAGRPTWTLMSRVGKVPAHTGEFLGSDSVTGDVRVSMYRSATGFQMVFDDTGCFDISADGSTLCWTHSSDVTTADAWTDLTGRVLAAAHHAAGTTCLHASAVVTSGEAIGFVAPKYHGKSTLALALVRAGAKLLTDDTLPVVTGPPALALPGLHAARLWPDAAERVGIGEARTVGSSTKRLFGSLPDAQVAQEAFPLSALYLLAPVHDAGNGAAAWRTRLSAAESAMVMIGHAKLAPLLKGTESPRLFRQAAHMAEHVPVYRLNVVRDLSQLDMVVSTVRSWHDSGPAAQ